MLFTSIAEQDIQIIGTEAHICYAVVSQTVVEVNFKSNEDSNSQTTRVVVQLESSHGKVVDGKVASRLGFFLYSSGNACILLFLKKKANINKQTICNKRRFVMQP